MEVTMSEYHDQFGGGGWNGGTLICDIFFFFSSDIWYFIFLGGVISDILFF